MLQVPEDCATLKEAVRTASTDSTIHIIVIGKGKHRVEKDGGGLHYLHIDFPITIIGSGKKKDVVILGGFVINNEESQDMVNLRNMTIRHSKKKGSGIVGKSSFQLEDVIVERCDGFGVVASGTFGVAVCTNVEVRQCGYSGVYASYGGSITLSGLTTTVHHNSTKGDSKHFGLLVLGALSEILLVHPLTKEIVATNNQGGGEWGASDEATLDQISIQLILN